MAVAGPVNATLSVLPPKPKINAGAHLRFAAWQEVRLPSAGLDWAALEQPPSFTLGPGISDDAPVDAPLVDEGNSEVSLAASSASIADGAIASETVTDPGTFTPIPSTADLGERVLQDLQQHNEPPAWVAAEEEPAYLGFPVPNPPQSPFPTLPTLQPANQQESPAPTLARFTREWFDKARMSNRGRGISKVAVVEQLKTLGVSVPSTTGLENTYLIDLLEVWVYALRSQWAMLDGW